MSVAAKGMVRTAAVASNGSSPIGQRSSRLLPFDLLAEILRTGRDGNGRRYLIRYNAAALASGGFNLMGFQMITFFLGAALGLSGLVQLLPIFEALALSVVIAALAEQNFFPMPRD